MENGNMTSTELRATLASMGVSQAELSRLLGVTTRGVAMWVAGDRPISGPAEAYLRLLQSLPRDIRTIELGRLRNRHRG